MAKKRASSKSHPYAWLAGGLALGVTGTLLAKKYMMPAAPSGQVLTPGGLDVFDMGQHIGANLAPQFGMTLPSGETNWRLLNGQWVLVDGIGRIVRYA